jgi:glycosyltransferase involved in cell wall biosynthesis
MRILQVNKYNYLRGGAERYMLSVTKKLEEAGHEVAIFSMQHPKNLPSPWSKYFVSRISFNEFSLHSYFLAPFRIIYSFEAKRKFKKLLEDFQPDVIHVHNIYNQISPSILPVAKKKGIPVIMHLHDYSLVSPDHQMFCHGKIYTRCLAGGYYHCVIDRCHKNSYLKSLLVVIAMYVHRFLKIYERNVDLYIAPSNFMKETCVKAGMNKDKIKVIYNFADTISTEPITSGDYLLFLGRLSEEKGVATLIKAAVLANKPLKIVGTGSEEERLKNLAKKLNNQLIKFTGFQSGKNLENIILDCRGVVIPSISHDNMPFVLLEALALGKPVIVSNLGGLGELVKTGENGFIFKAGSVENLVEKITELYQVDSIKMGLAARNSILDLTIDKHIKRIVNIYEEVIHN